LRIPAIDDLLDILEVVQDKIKLVDGRIRDETDEDVQLLETIPGVGHVIAATIKAEVGELERFDSSDLVSNAGLALAVRQSGEGKAHIGGMSKQGDPRLRHMLVEAVHIHVMFCDSRTSSYYRRKKEEK